MHACWEESDVNLPFSPYCHNLEKTVLSCTINADVFIVEECIMKVKQVKQNVNQMVELYEVVLSPLHKHNSCIRIEAFVFKLGPVSKSKNLTNREVMSVRV